MLTGRFGLSSFSSAASMMIIRSLMMGTACLAAVLIHLINGRHTRGNSSLNVAAQQMPILAV